jgi:hypothetical protein
MLSRFLGLCFAFAVIVSPALAASDEAPAWLQQAAAIKPPAYEKDVPAVVLQNEQHVTVGQDGRVTTVTTVALRVLLREGRDFAMATEFYQSDAGRVREMKAWLIRPSGQVKRYGKDDTIDAIEDQSDVYNESRVKIIDASKDADTGAVFGYQTTTEDRSIFSQYIFSFQSQRLPVIDSRYSLTLPPAWHARAVAFNYENIEPVVNDSTYSWEIRNIPPVMSEPSSPRVTSLEPRLAVSCFPPGDTKPSAVQSYANWGEVSRWASALHDPQWAPDLAITEKVKQLTASAKTEMEQIRAISRYVQNVRYISIQIGVSRGGGMRPHAASQVFAKSYGDCKDKANLMRAMLKVLNITSYPVAIYSGDPTYVREEWASPFQFNHCIIAVKVSDETQVATVITHPKLGRLMIFDATDDDTPVGDLPEHEQGSLALIIAPEGGTLMRMPVTPPEANGLERQIDATLSAEGTLAATVQERAAGSWASSYRSEYRHDSRPDFTKRMERWISNGAAAAKVGELAASDHFAEDRFDLNLSFSAAEYGQLMQNRLLVFKPAIVSRRESLFLSEGKRKYPVVLDARAFSETLRLKLPAGFDVDELPDAVKLEASFGSYKTSYEVKNGELVFTRAMSVRATTIPADQYESVRGFYAKIRAAEQAPVVLARK